MQTRNRDRETSWARFPGPTGCRYFGVKLQISSTARIPTRSSQPLF